MTTTYPDKAATVTTASTERIEIRCTAEEKAAWTAAAERADYLRGVRSGRRLSSWIRHQLDVAAERYSPTPDTHNAPDGGKENTMTHDIETRMNNQIVNDLNGGRTFHINTTDLAEDYPRTENGLPMCLHSTRVAGAPDEDTCFVFTPDGTWTWISDRSSDFDFPHEAFHPTLADYIVKNNAS